MQFSAIARVTLLSIVDLRNEDCTTASCSNSAKSSSSNAISRNDFRTPSRIASPGATGACRSKAHYLREKRTRHPTDRIFWDRSSSTFWPLQPIWRKPISWLTPSESTCTNSYAALKPKSSQLSSLRTKQSFPCWKTAKSTCYMKLHTFRILSLTTTRSVFCCSRSRWCMAQSLQLGGSVVVDVLEGWLVFADGAFELENEFEEAMVDVEFEVAFSGTVVD